MQQLQYQMRGSTGAIHTLHLNEDNGQVSFKCSCRGSVNKHILCKHRLALLAGDLTDLIDINKWDSKQFLDIIYLLDVEDSMGEIIELLVKESSYNLAKSLLKQPALVAYNEVYKNNLNPELVNIIDTDSYNSLLENGNFSMYCPHKGFNSFVFNLDGKCLGVLKTSRGIKINTDSLTFRSEKYLKEFEYYNPYLNCMDIEMKMGFDMIDISVINTHPACRAKPTNTIRNQAKQLANLFAAI